MTSCTNHKDSILSHSHECHECAVLEFLHAYKVQHNVGGKMSVAALAAADKSRITKYMRKTPGLRAIDELKIAALAAISKNAEAIDLAIGLPWDGYFQACKKAITQASQ